MALQDQRAERFVVERPVVAPPRPHRHHRGRHVVVARREDAVLARPRRHHAYGLYLGMVRRVGVLNHEDRLGLAPEVHARPAVVAPGDEVPPVRWDGHGFDPAPIGVRGLPGSSSAAATAAGYATFGWQRPRHHADGPPIPVGGYGDVRRAPEGDSGDGSGELHRALFSAFHDVPHPEHGVLSAGDEVPAIRGPRHNAGLVGAQLLAQSSVRYAPHAYGALVVVASRCHIFAVWRDRDHADALARRRREP